jgi:rare lipoprotein A (peptidoglycan hydrolase)
MRARSRSRAACAVQICAAALAVAVPAVASADNDPSLAQRPAAHALVWPRRNIAAKAVIARLVGRSSGSARKSKHAVARKHAWHEHGSRQQTVRQRAHRSPRYESHVSPHSELASWYYDEGATACGFHAGYGVANRTLPCGTKVTIRYGYRRVVATVDDRGPYVGGRSFDLDQRTAMALGFAGVGTVRVS